MGNLGGSHINFHEKFAKGIPKFQDIWEVPKILEKFPKFQHRGKFPIFQVKLSEPKTYIKKHSCHKTYMYIFVQ